MTRRMQDNGETLKVCLYWPDVLPYHFEMVSVVLVNTERAIRAASWIREYKELQTVHHST